MQALQQIQNLRLDGDVERRGRFIGNQHLRPPGQRHGDHGALFHAAGKLVRVFAESAFRIGDADGVEQFDQPAPSCGRRQAPVLFGQRLTQLVTDGHHRVERTLRLLKNHGHAPAAPGAHLALAQAHQVDAGDLHFPARQPSGRRRQQSQQRQRRDRLAAPGFADQRQRHSRGDGEVEAIDGVHDSFRCVENRPQTAHPQNRLIHRSRHRRNLGSKASRTASANRLAASTSVNMNRKAAPSVHHTIGSRAISRRAPLIMLPQESMVGSTPTPI